MSAEAARFVRSILSSWLAVVMLSACSAAGYQGVVTPTADAPFRSTAPELAPVAALPLPVPSQRTLANGLRMIVVERPNTPTTEFVYVNRAAHDSGRADDSGLAMLTRRAIEEATLLGNGQLVHGLVILGLRPEGGTGRFASTFGVTAFAEEADSALAGLARVVRFPALDTETLSSVRTLQARDRFDQSRMNGNVLHRVAFEILWGAGSPQALPAGAGHNRNLARFTDDVVKSFYDERYRPSQSALIVVGPVQAGPVFELVERYFGDWHDEPAATPPKAGLPAEPTLYEGSGLRLVGLVTDKQHASFEVAAPCVGYSNPDYLVFEVISALIDSSITSPLYQELRLASGNAYHLRANCDERRDGGNFSLWFDSDAGTARVALTNVLNELDRFSRGQITPSELEVAQRAVAMRWKHSLRDNANVAQDLAWHFSLDLPSDDASVLAQLRAITKERIRDVAQRYFRHSQLVVALAANPAFIGQSLSPFGRIEWRDAWNRRGSLQTSSVGARHRAMP